MTYLICALRLTLFQSYGKTDRNWLKCFVFVAWVLDSVHEALLLNNVYIDLVTDIGDLPALEITHL